MAQYETWAAETTLALTADEQTFLTASGEAQRQKEAAEEARLQRELETARQLAETERRRAEDQVQAAQNLRRRAVYLGAALVVAAMLALVAIYAGSRANENAETAVANANIAATQEAAAFAAEAEAVAQAAEAENNAELAATAEAIAEEERSLALANEASALENEAAASTAQAEAVAQAEIARLNEAQAQSLALTSSARRALTSGDLDLDVALAVEAVNIEQPPAAAVRTLTDVAYAPGTRYIAESGHEGQGFVQMSPDGRTLVTSVSNYSSESAVSVWDSISGEILN